MARKKYFYPPTPPTGSQTFSDDLVGFQLTQGGGLTQGNFEFTSAIFEKSNRSFDTGVFSTPYNLTNLNISNIEQSKLLVQKNFQVYPNFDISQITSFSLYGSLQKRVSSSITKIINYFPAALTVKEYVSVDFTAQTAYNVIYDQLDDETTFDVFIPYLNNPFDIDYTQNAKQNVSFRPIKVSEYRDITTNFKNFAVYLSDPYGEEYKIVDFTPSTSISAGTLNIVVKGNPFSGQSAFTKTLIIKPNNEITEKIFSDSFDEIEDFFLNRRITPRYTSVFQYPDYDAGGNYTLYTQNVTWPLNDVWNLDIVSDNFDTFLTEVQRISELLDSYKTNLISRFLTTGSIKDFDTPDQKMEKVLQIYGRSFDETKKFIDALAYMNSVNYVVGNDIPSQLLSNLAQTLGFNTNISPITNEDFFNSVFTTSNDSPYGGMSKPMTPTELNYQFYRNLILNAAYLYKSKGTRRSIEFVLRMAGAPDALIEFNEMVYLADGPINYNDFRDEYVCISGSTLVVDTPVLDPTITFSIQGTIYTGFTSSSSLQNVSATFKDFPIYEDGYPKAVTDSAGYYFQKNAGWFEQTPQHYSSEVVDVANSTFTNTGSTLVTKFTTFDYGQAWLDRFRHFPFMTNMGYNLQRTPDNKKSWLSSTTGLRKNGSLINPVYYSTESDKLVINVKNMELYLNMGQGITYDIWEQSVNYNYPIPNTGLTAPYPTPGDTDWTVVNPKPNQKTFFEFAQTFYNNLINVRNRLYINDGKTGGYPALQSIFWKYLQSETAMNIPSNNFTYQKMIDFTLGLGDYWIRLVEQYVPATTIWMTGQKMDNSAFHRQKYVWRRQRGCTIIPVSCDPCEYNGEVFGYDCINDTVSCKISNELNGAELLSTAIESTLSEEKIRLLSNPITQNKQLSCNFNGMKTYWYVDLRLDDVCLIQEQFYTGYGNVDFPSFSNIINGINQKLEGLYVYGLNYYLAGNTLIVSNSSCYTNLSNKTLKLNIGIMVDLNCQLVD